MGLAPALDLHRHGPQPARNIVGRAVVIRGEEHLHAAVLQHSFRALAVDVFELAETLTDQDDPDAVASQER